MDGYLINLESFKITQTEFLIRLLVALGIGFLIGLEREHAALSAKLKGFAGVRTLIFVVLLGFMGAMSYYIFSPWIFVGILLTVVMITGISYWITASRGEIGATTEFSVLIAFLLGSTTFLGFVEISLMITVLVVVLLSAKLKLKSIVGEITAGELYDFIRFVVMALLLFPFLPNQTYGPYNVLNPREIGWVILLTSGLGFVGYILMKFMGAKKGILLSGIVGGLVSSTAVTWVFSKKSKENDSLSANCAVAILAASSIMVVRVLVWTFLFNKTLFDHIYWAIGMVFIAAMGITIFFFVKHGDKEVTDTPIRNEKPLDLQGAMIFGLIYIAILLIVSYANEQLGNKGLLISSAVAGLSDIDAITISVSKLAGTSLGLDLAANAVLIATVSNTLVKMGIGIWAGSKQLRKYLYIGYGIIFVVAIIAIVLLNVG